MKRSHLIVAGIVLFGAIVVAALFWSFFRVQDNVTRHRDILMSGMASKLGNNFDTIAFGPHFSHPLPCLMATTGDSFHWNADSSSLVASDIHILQRDSDGTSLLLQVSSQSVQTSADTLINDIDTSVARFRFDFDPPFGASRSSQDSSIYVLITPLTRDASPAGDVLAFRYRKSLQTFVLE